MQHTRNTTLARAWEINSVRCIPEEKNLTNKFHVYSPSAPAASGFFAFAITSQSSVNKKKHSRTLINEL